MTKFLPPLLLSMLLLPGPAWAESADEAVARAATLGLPVAAVKNKISEGRIKRVPEQRVARVAGALVDLMQSSRRWLTKNRRPYSDALLQAMAEAQLAGVSEQTVRQMAHGAGPREMNLRVDALADLHLRGYRGASAVALVRAGRADQVAGLGLALDTLAATTRLSRAELLDELGAGVKANRGNLGKALGQIRGKAAQAKVKPGQAAKAKGPKKGKAVGPKK